MMTSVVVITGVAGGIGHATAKCFRQAKWTVVGVDRKPTDAIDAVDCYIQADLGDVAAVHRAIAQISQEFSAVHSLVNNAALQICKPATQMSVAEWDQVMAVNVRSAFLLAQGLHSLLQQGRGSIVNVSSVHAIATSANIAAYATSKGALLAMTRALAIEFASDQIRVNAVLPGAVDTIMLRDGLQRGHLSGASIDNLLTDLGRKTVMGRVGEPSEIAEAILFLADSSRSSFLTGQSIVVDGGAIARLSTE
jgi:NAD(P)-dependent dehydrogenase (short-subunit alcohol dehydrogenase family)